MISYSFKLWDEMSRWAQYMWILWFTIALFVLAVAIVIFLRAALNQQTPIVVVKVDNTRKKKKRGKEKDFDDFSIGWRTLISARLAHFWSALPRKYQSLLVVLLISPFLLLIPVGILTSWDVTFLRDLGITSKRLPGGETVIGSEGHDQSGKLATYEVIILSREYYWRYGSSTVVINVDGDPVAMEEKLKEGGIKDRVARMSDLIAIGTASCVGGAEEESGRALERANTLMAWLRSSSFSIKLERLYVLNLGKYSLNCDRGRRERAQRAVIIVGVTEKQSGVNIRESFRDALFKVRNKVFFNLDIEGYSNWTADKFALNDVT